MYYPKVKYGLSLVISSFLYNTEKKKTRKKTREKKASSHISGLSATFDQNAAFVDLDVLLVSLLL